MRPATRFFLSIASALVVPAPFAIAPANAQPAASLSAGHPAAIPGLPYPAYVVPVPPRDDRTPRQRCWDDESARIGRPLTDLDRRAIDLKCSQR